MKWLVLAANLIVTCSLALSQTSAPSKPSFEVASIKPSTPGLRESLKNEPGRFLATNVTARMMIGFAFQLRPFQLAGGPNWIAEDQWDIEAKPPSSDRIDADVTTLRLQTLLEDRFALRTHREMREVPVYALVVDKGGPKMKNVDPPGPSGQPAPPPPRLRPDGTLPPDFTPRPGAAMVGPGIILASAIPLAQIINVLSGQVGRPVVDRTNLTGYFNIRLQFAPENTAAAPRDPTGPSIFTAVQEQLGLKLESAKQAFEVLVIDDIRKPTEN